MPEPKNAKEAHVQPTVLLSRSDLKSLGITLSNSSLLRAEARGAFPRRLRLSPAKVCWDRAEVAEWLERRKAERATWNYADAR